MTSFPVINALLLPIVAVKDVDGRVKPRHDELKTCVRGSKMQTKLPFSIAFALAAALLLSACAQFERNTPPQAVVDDDAYCRANGGEPGSSPYVACMKDRDVAASRAAGGSRIERAHRNMAEDMLNNRR